MPDSSPHSEPERSSRSNDGTKTREFSGLVSFVVVRQGGGASGEQLAAQDRHRLAAEADAVAVERHLERSAAR